MKKIWKRLSIAACALTASACLAPAFAGTLARATENAEWSEVALEEQYVLDDVITIPSRTLTIGGTSYSAEAKLVYPNGTTRFLNDSGLALTETGKYTLVYEAKDSSSRYYTSEETFVVADKLWRVTKEKSSVSYGKAGNTSGLLVELAKGDTLTFNKIIDVSELTSATSLVEGFINPANVGMSEFERLTFTLTDVEDPTQTLTVIGSRSQSSDNYMFMSYWTAAGTGQTQGGFSGDKFITNGVILGLRGTPLPVSFYSYNGKYFINDEGKTACTSWASEPDETPFKVAFDAKTCEVVVNGKNVADLDNSAYYAKEPIWNGFPSGKATLSIQAVECSGETANFCISKLFSYDLTSENKFVESDAPEITVEADEKYVKCEQGNYSFIPYAVVGGKYPVPTATAFDDYSGELSVTAKVYFNYNNAAARMEVPVQDGVFSVTRSGTYAVVYTATDDFGNTAERVYWVTSVQKLDNPVSVAVPDGATDNGLCGETIRLADPIVSGGSGDVTVTVTVESGNDVTIVTDQYFIPEKAGVWTVRYVAKDYSGITAEASYTITVEAGKVPVFVNEPTLLRYFVSGMEYTVPTVYAYDYSSGEKQARVADMLLKDANGEHTYTAGESFIPVAEENDPFVALTFTVGGAKSEKKVPVVFPLQDAGNGRKYFYIEKAFVTENVTATRSKTGLTVLATENGDSAWKYINPVAAENASLKVKGIRGQSNYDGLKVTFTDYADSSVSVTMYLKHTGSYAQVSFGDTDRALTKGFNMGTDSAGNALDDFTFSYKSGKFYVDSVGVTVAKDDNGNAFNGFASERVYISAELVNATAGSGYIVTSLDNHTISNVNTDIIVPRIAINGVYGGMYDLGDEYVITKAIASDVVDTTVRCYLTVKTPNGDVATDVNGKRLDKVDSDTEYTVLLSQYGAYNVEYTAADCFGNKASTVSYSVNIFDQVAPNATLANTWSATASVGDRVILPEVTVSDNVSSAADISVYRYVRNPNGVVTTLGYDYTVNADGSLSYTKYAYTFRYAGEYRFVILVTDGTGNQTTVQYSVTVQ